VEIKILPVLTQIYEISSPGEAAAISAIGVDHTGVLVGTGEFPRELPLARAADVARSIAPPSKFSALFLSADVSLIERWARELRPAIVHLGAAPQLLSPAATRILKEKLPRCLVMRSVPVSGEESIPIAESYDGIVDFLARQLPSGGPADWGTRRHARLANQPTDCRTRSHARHPRGRSRAGQRRGCDPSGSAGGCRFQDQDRS
jgi:phosphoribosylanthranilate isomerase